MQKKSEPTVGRALVLCAAACVLAGCLSAPPHPRNWTMAPAAARVLHAAAPAHDVSVRLAHLTVRPPYDQTRLVVLRADGSLAFDAYNVFAAPPAGLLRGPAFDILEASGVFRRVIRSASAADAQNTLEIEVEELALDCRASDLRTARVRVAVTMLAKRDVRFAVRGEAAVEVAQPSNYTAAFSEAFTQALMNALAKDR